MVEIEAQGSVGPTVIAVQEHAQTALEAALELGGGAEDAADALQGARGNTHDAALGGVGACRLCGEPEARHDVRGLRQRRRVSHSSAAAAHVQRASVTVLQRECSGNARAARGSASTASHCVDAASSESRRASAASRRAKAARTSAGSAS